MSDSIIGKGTLLQRNVTGDWVTVAEMITISGPGPDSDDLEATNHDSPGYAKEFKPGLYDPGEISFDGNFLPGNVTQDRLYSDQKNLVVSSWRIVLPDADDIDDRTKHAGKGYVKNLDFEQATPELLSISGTIKATGEWIMASEYAADLTALSISDGTLVPEFDGETYKYLVSVANATSFVTVTPTCAAADHIYVNGEEVDTGDPSSPINLDVGFNEITVEVAEDDKSTRITTIVVGRESA